MQCPTFVVCTAVAACTIGYQSTALAQCDARSGPRTAALIELYTSEGCSSCPPADEHLRQLRRTLDPAADFVALSLHVGYWDYIGWKDPYAQTAFADRQSWLVRANQRSFRYTPEFFVNGSELRSWRDALHDKVKQVNSTHSAADIRVRAKLAPDGTLAMQAEAETRSPAQSSALYLALSESNLSSNVARGENSGRMLIHDHVVRAWIGPVPLTAGAVKLSRDIRIEPSWNRGRLDLIAFVQDQRTGAVLQALSAPHCAVD
jgi:hypothetical protein